MNQQNYIDRYKQLLKKPNINQADIRRFKQAVEHYKIMFPQWQETQRI